MTRPEVSQARIDAALRLAEAAAKYTEQLRDCRGEEDYLPVDRAYDAYRATLPKLRTRAEVDADIVELVRGYDRAEPPGIRETAVGMLRVLNRLCAEPTAPEPAPECSVCHGKGYTDDCQCEYVHSCKVCPRGAKWAEGIPMRNENAKKPKPAPGGELQMLPSYNDGLDGSRF